MHLHWKNEDEDECQDADELEKSEDLIDCLKDFYERICSRVDLFEQECEKKMSTCEKMDLISRKDNIKWTKIEFENRLRDYMGEIKE